jgi:hypothetical protein
VVLDAERSDPAALLDELKSPRDVEAGPEEERDRELDERDGERRPPEKESRRPLALPTSSSAIAPAAGERR